MNISLVATDSLIPYINNPRDNSNAIDKVAASIKEFGFRQPIVIDDESVIVAGHTRYMAAKKLNLEHVPVEIVHDLTELQIKAYRIADNRVAQESTWDDQLLNIEIQNLDNNNFDLSLTGFNEDEIEIILSDDDINNADTSEQHYDSVFQIIVDCSTEREQENLFGKFKAQGLTCKVVSI